MRHMIQLLYPALCHAISNGINAHAATMVVHTEAVLEAIDTNAEVVAGSTRDLTKEVASLVALKKRDMDADSSNWSAACEDVVRTLRLAGNHGATSAVCPPRGMHLVGKDLFLAITQLPRDGDLVVEFMGGWTCTCTSFFLMKSPGFQL